MITVCATVAPHKLEEPSRALEWLADAEKLRDATPWPIRFFCAIEIDARGLHPLFDELCGRLHELFGVWWTFHLDQAPEDPEPFEVRTGWRHVRVCTGRNLGIEYTLRQPDATHALFLDTDIGIGADTIVKLVEVGQPVVFGHTPSYGLDGPPIPDLAGDTRRHWDSAGCVLVQRQVLRHVSWGHDPDALSWDGHGIGLSDDPRFARDVERMGFGSVVTRHDLHVQHNPPGMVRLEGRNTDRWLRKAAADAF